jgi:hypothetical protein
VTASLDATGPEAAALGVTSVAESADRAVVRVCGRIAYVEVAPQQGPARLLASVDDGTGSLEAVFMGRRIIPGIRPGQRISIEGRIVTEGGVRRIYNPRYELSCPA